MPVGFIGEDAREYGTLIHGLPVLGGRDSLEDLTHDRRIEMLIVTPSYSGHVGVHDLVSRCNRAGLRMVRLESRVHAFAEYVPEPLVVEDAGGLRVVR